MPNTNCSICPQKVDKVITVNDGSTVSESVIAPTGYVVVGGGFTLDDLGMTVLASRPSSDLLAWEVTVHNSSGFTQTVRISGVFLQKCGCT
jgi:hypothetical protein